MILNIHLLFKMNQKGLTPILIVLILAALVGGYLVYQNQPKPTSPTPLSSETSVKEEDPTANWKTYTTDNFTFKYPQNYIVKKTYDNFYDLYQNQNPIDTRTVIGVNATMSNVTSSYDRAVESAKALLENPTIETVPLGIKLTGRQKLGSYGGGVLHKIAILKFDDKAIQIETADPDQVTVDLFDQILSTFKFTN